MRATERSVASRKSGVCSGVRQFDGAPTSCSQMGLPGSVAKPLASSIMYSACRSDATDRPPYRCAVPLKIQECTVVMSPSREASAGVKPWPSMYQAASYSLCTCCCAGAAACAASSSVVIQFEASASVTGQGEGWVCAENWLVSLPRVKPRKFEASPSRSPNRVTSSA